ncbi:MAG: ergothioneine biosynthesis protein EgtB [Candidatus Thiodiazotropha sp. (ex Dulcina madagascariensis)]|nr:ergothioneine biosynthesis protein EgtB [Candidatus Thiodiazotropha sp. (ex Dulcina madagascariensis)]
MTFSDPVQQPQSRESLAARYRAMRQVSERLCEPLEPDDYQLQSITETSPPKWHLAHVSWFFEAFILTRYRPDYPLFHPRFDYLFNSYYYTLGNMHPRPKRGLLSRPTLKEVYAYREYVDRQMLELIAGIEEEHWQQLEQRVILGLNHEQQHQELLLMDTKHNLSANPLLPAYRSDLSDTVDAAPAMGWREQAGGIYEIGHGGEGFGFDNETPRHQVLMQDHRLADRLVTNGEYLRFMEDGGYIRSEFWLADGWALLNEQGWRHPLYWHLLDGSWRQFTLGGLRDLNLHEPVCHISYYEADAFARWSGKRLPREEELELALNGLSSEGNFLEEDRLHPTPANGGGQWYGDLWNWTSSSYAAYPGFQPLSGSMGEYNGKFMSNQMVLKGGACVTPADHIRASYRNFFYPHDRWQFSGLRLAMD